MDRRNCKRVRRTPATQYSSAPHPHFPRSVRQQPLCLFAPGFPKVSKNNTSCPNFCRQAIWSGGSPSFALAAATNTFIASPSDARSPIVSGPSAAQSERQPETRRRAASGRRARGFMSSRLYPPASDGIGPADGLLGHYLGRDDDEDLRVTQLLRGSIRTKQVVSSAAIRSLQSVPLSELEPHEMSELIPKSPSGTDRRGPRN